MWLNLPRLARFDPLVTLANGCSFVGRSSFIGVRLVVLTGIVSTGKSPIQVFRLVLFSTSAVLNQPDSLLLFNT